MRWQGRRQSTNVDDRRKISAGKMVAGGGIGAIIIYFLVTCNPIGNPFAVQGDRTTTQQPTHILAHLQGTQSRCTKANLAKEPKFFHSTFINFAN